QASDGGLASGCSQVSLRNARGVPSRNPARRRSRPTRFAGMFNLPGHFVQFHPALARIRLLHDLDSAWLSGPCTSSLKHSTSKAQVPQLGVMYKGGEVDVN